MKSRVHAVLLAAILCSSFVLKLRHLDHAAVKPLDEVFHAIVAQNFLKHPFTPTLVDQPFLGSNDRNWQAGHIWLHKPPLAMWQIAISYVLFGVNTMALRLPSAILSTLAAWLTYLIGSQLLDKTSGLIAAGFQAFNPAILMIVNGYVFSDHVDISLLFWSEVSIYFLVRAIRTGRTIDFVLCGVGQGLAFLSKSFPALFITGLALVAWLLPLTPLGRKDDSRIKVRGFLWLILATTVTALPWIIYTAIRFPTEFRHDNLLVLSHLDRDVEGWGAPWDRVFFNYWIEIFYVYFPLILAAAALIAVRAWQERRTYLWIVLAWAVGVTVPNLMATSKTMTATLVAWPAMWLMAGHLISRAVHGDKWALGTWLIATILAVGFIHSNQIPNGGWGNEPGGFGAIMRQHLWVVWQLLAALSLGALLGWSLFKNNAMRNGGIILAWTATLLLAARWWKGEHPRGYVVVAWGVTQLDRESPSFADIGYFAHTLPLNAAFLVEENDRLENKLIEFRADRTCYSSVQEDWHDRAALLETSGALPYLITARAVQLPLVFRDVVDNRNVYACTAQAEIAADSAIKGK